MIERTAPRLADLHLLRRPNARLAEALEAARTVIPKGYALLCAPAALLLRRVDELSLEDLTGLASPYEARFFAAEAEVRWVEVENSAGQAVLLAEEAPQMLVGWTGLDAPRRVLGLDRTYLVTPQLVEDVMGLGSGIPAIDPETQRLAAAAREYLAEVDNFGNVALLAERLTGFVGVKIGDKLPPRLEVADDWSPLLR